MALVKNNAKIGSLIAVELCRIRKLKEKKAVVSYNNVIATLSLIPFARVSVWLRILFTYDGVSVIIRSVERYDLVEIRPTESVEKYRCCSRFRRLRFSGNLIVGVISLWMA